MQNRYVGDTGDFGKYFLLKNLCKGKLRLGVNWCLVEDETQNNDGKHIGYLKNESGICSESDPELFRQLVTIVNSSQRDIFNVERSNVLPKNTLYFSETIPQGTRRFDWHDRSLKHLTASDIVFYDPDNGLEINSCSKLHQKAVKYVFFDEIRDTLRAGKSIIIYQHSNRSKKLELQIEDRIKQLTNCLNIGSKDIRIVSSGKGTSRYYLIVKQPQHSDMIDRNLTLIDNKYLSKILSVRI